MTYLLLAVQMLIPLILLLSPFILYRKGGKRMRAFYLSMASSPRSRKSFMLGLAVAVLLLSYTSFALKGAGLWQIPSLMLALARAEHVAKLMRDRGVPQERIEVRSEGGTTTYEPVLANRNCRIELFVH